MRRQGHQVETKRRRAAPVRLGPTRRSADLIRAPRSGARVTTARRRRRARAIRANPHARRRGSTAGSDPPSARGRQSAAPTAAGYTSRERLPSWALRGTTHDLVVGGGGVREGQEDGASALRRVVEPRAAAGAQQSDGRGRHLGPRGRHLGPFAQQPRRGAQGVPRFKLAARRAPSLLNKVVAGLVEVLPEQLPPECQMRLVFPFPKKDCLKMINIAKNCNRKIMLKKKLRIRIQIRTMTLANMNHVLLSVVLLLLALGAESRSKGGRRWGARGGSSNKKSDVLMSFFGSRGSSDTGMTDTTTTEDSNRESSGNTENPNIGRNIQNTKIDFNKAIDDYYRNKKKQGLRYNLDTVSSNCEKEFGALSACRSPRKRKSAPRAFREALEARHRSPKVAVPLRKAAAGQAVQRSGQRTQQVSRSRDMKPWAVLLSVVLLLLALGAESRPKGGGRGSSGGSRGGSRGWGRRWGGGGGGGWSRGRNRKWGSSGIDWGSSTWHSPSTTSNDYFNSKRWGSSDSSENTNFDIDFDDLSKQIDDYFERLREITSNLKYENDPNTNTSRIANMRDYFRNMTELYESIDFKFGPKKPTSSSKTEDDYSRRLSGTTDIPDSRNLQSSNIGSSQDLDNMPSQSSNTGSSQDLDNLPSQSSNTGSSQDLYNVPSRNSNTDSSKNVDELYSWLAAAAGPRPRAEGLSAPEFHTYNRRPGWRGSVADFFEASSEEDGRMVVEMEHRDDNEKPKCVDPSCSSESLQKCKFIQLDIYKIVIKIFYYILYTHCENCF
ncbi:Protein of unknown function [Gryllus bimaculatus]|nr:Protein of unknown function [Gryllus bimaculatus]